MIIPLHVKTLTASDARRNIDELIAVAADVPGEYWTKEHFLADLPQKWRLSFTVWECSFLAGYAILSQKTLGHVHLHHLMVSKRSRNRGLGKRMVDEIISRCGAVMGRRLTLKTQRANCGAIRFYQRCGFDETDVSGDYVVMTKAL